MWPRRFSQNSWTVLVTQSGTGILPITKETNTIDPILPFYKSG
jgi:hypothetical protein